MKLRLLKEALEHYVLSADCSENDRQDVFAAITECAQLEERYSDRELWKDSVHVITTSSLIDFLNMTTYDDFGKLAKSHDGRPPFDYYANEVRCGFQSDLTDNAIRCGYDFLCDLWGDNERYGNNNEDGTFRHD